MMKKCKGFGLEMYATGCAGRTCISAARDSEPGFGRPGARLEYNNGAGVAMAAHLDAFHAAEVSWTPST